MEIIKADERIKYIHTCKECHSQIAIYPNDVKNCFCDIVPSTLPIVNRRVKNRKMHTICPVCGSPLIVSLDDTPCFFKQWMSRLNGWKTNN